jgi:hypothetical protein
MSSRLTIDFRAQNYGYEGLLKQSKSVRTDTLQLLHCGNLEVDEGWFMRGGGTTTASNPTNVAKRRKAVIISVLIEHPTEGLILFETGGGENYPEGSVVVNSDLSHTPH